MSMMILAAAMVAAPAAQPAPAGAEGPSVATTADPSAPPVDPARLALARTTIDYVWPLGTYQRMMSGTFDKMMDGIMESMSDMKLEDLVPPDAAGKPADPKLANASFRQAMAKVDPSFMERMRITNHVMMQAIVPLMNKFEPDIREGLVRAYARKFTAEQLADMNRFFATPSGRAYASEAMFVMMDPEVVRRMAKFMPEFIQAMPQIMDKVKQATAHLPPPRPASATARAKLLPNKGKGAS